MSGPVSSIISQAVLSYSSTVHSIAISAYKGTVAIFGATGDIGESYNPGFRDCSCMLISHLYTGVAISQLFLEKLDTSFSTIRIISRNVSSAKAQELATKGGELRSLDEPLDKLLADIDVVVNCLPTELSNEYKTELTKASLRNGVKVFFLSEFGM